jgi:hypothetical protein
MPTLVMSDQFLAPEKSILLKTFNFCCRQYDIQNKDASVFLTKRHFKDYRMRGRMTRADKDFIMELSDREGIVELSSVVVHETTHVGQYLNGKLMDDNSGLIDGGCWWEGHYYPRSICLTREEAVYKILPWEIEAFTNQEYLTKQSWRCLSGIDRDFMLRQAVIGIDQDKFSVPGVPDWFIKKICKQYGAQEAHGN